MHRLKKFLIPAIIVAVAVGILYMSQSTDGGPSYSSITTGNLGTSLLYDTLSHMGYPVARSHRQLTTQTNVNYVYILIQPLAQHIHIEAREEMLEWVRSGGRLIFLHNRRPTLIDDMLRRQGIEGVSIGDLTLYQVGLGEVITGRAFAATNNALISDASIGRDIEFRLRHWDNVERILFGEYYQGFHRQPRRTLLGGLPFVMQLLLIQLVIFVLVMLWHVGKRFGKPMPF